MQNSLYYGDNLEVLRKFVPSETVDLCYIDPPFNSKRNYNQIYNNIGTVPVVVPEVGSLALALPVLGVVGVVVARHRN